MMMSTERIFHPDAPQGIQPPAAHTHLPRFGLIVVGDEILSGRRQDSHVPKMIELLGERGLALSYVHMLGDNRTQLTQLLRQVLASGDVVMCCGGIGATPDDHTRQAAAAAAGVTLALHPVARDLIEQRMQAMAAEKGVEFVPVATGPKTPTFTQRFTEIVRGVDPSTLDIAVCGPKGLLDEVRKLAKSHGVAPARIRHELFAFR